MMRGIRIECLNNLEDVQTTIKPGQICFARDVDDNKWYRGQIIDVPSSMESSSKVSKLIQEIFKIRIVLLKYMFCLSQLLPSREHRQVKIRFVDYGKVSFCKYADILPATKYTDIPVQSYCGKLQGTLIVRNFKFTSFTILSNYFSNSIK